MKNFLSEKGLSMTQAQSVSNLCNQSALEIDAIINKVNNASSIVDYEGQQLEMTPGNPLPTKILDLLMAKGQFRACQAFLMEQIKAKEELLRSLKAERFHSEEAIEYPVLETFRAIPLVNEKWGWDQLTHKETAEFIEHEAIAAALGLFIHKNGKLDTLRTELSNLKALDWFVDPGKTGKAYPVIIKKHHTEDELFQLHQAVADLHRKAEQRVNYFKAKVLNAVTLENASIEKENADKRAKVNAENNIILAKYREESNILEEKLKVEEEEFNADRLKRIKETSDMRISIPENIAEIVNMFLNKEKGESS